MYRKCVTFLRQLPVRYPNCHHTKGGADNRTCRCHAFFADNDTGVAEVARFLTSFTDSKPSEQEIVIRDIVKSRRKKGRSSQTFTLPGTSCDLCLSALQDVTGCGYRYWNKKIRAKPGEEERPAFLDLAGRLHLQAKEVAEQDIVGAAPYILPDGVWDSHVDAYRPKTMSRKQYFRARSRASTTFRRGAREYLRGCVYLNTHSHTKVYTIRAKDLTDAGAVVDVTIDDPCTVIPDDEKTHPFRMCVFKTDDHTLLSGVPCLGKELEQRVAPNARSKGEVCGSMWVLGRKMNGKRLGSYISARAGKSETPAKRECLKRVQEAARRVSTSMARVVEGGPWKSLLHSIRTCERKYGIYPEEVLGGKYGCSATVDFSKNLGNESHFDVNDRGLCLAVWVEEKPGTASGWYLYFPNMLLEVDGLRYEGLRIELCHGAMVSWDGRVMKHFTSITNVGDNNNVYSFFAAPNRNLVRPLEKKLWGGIHRHAGLS